MPPLHRLTLITLLLPLFATTAPLPSPAITAPPCNPPPTTFAITDFTLFTGPLLSLVQFSYSSSSYSSFPSIPSSSGAAQGGGAGRQTSCTHFSLTSYALAAPPTAGGGAATTLMQPCADAGVAFAWDAATGTVAVAETSCGNSNSNSGYGYGGYGYGNANSSQPQQQPQTQTTTGSVALATHCTQTDETYFLGVGRLCMTLPGGVGGVFGGVVKG